MGKETVTQVQEAQRVSGRINPRKNMPRHIVIKGKKKNLKQQRKNDKQHTSEFPYSYQLIDFSAKLCRPKGSGMTYLN